MFLHLDPAIRLLEFGEGNCIAVLKDARTEMPIAGLCLLRKNQKKNYPLVRDLLLNNGTCLPQNTTQPYKNDTVILYIFMERFPDVLVSSISKLEQF